MNEIPKYPQAPLPPQKKPIVIKESSFSKPGSMGKVSGRGWAPAKGVKFRALSVKRGVGRPRKRLRDPRFVEFY